MAESNLLVLVRHGEAKSDTEDSARPLTDEGRKTVERMAAWTLEAGIRVQRIQHSGKLRAEQTAQIFGDRLGTSVEQVQGLRPNDDVVAFARSLDAESLPLMLVGHLPFLVRMVGHLVADNADRAIVRFEAATVVVLSREEGVWTIECVVQPTRFT